MPHLVYILFSPTGNTFYIGETENLERRLNEHNNHLFSGSQTTRFSDWEVFLQIECFDRRQARKVEDHIKRMKSTVYILNLKKYPQIIANLILKY